MVSFDEDFDLTKATVDITSRKLTSKEFDYFDLRNKTMNLINKDSIFEFYKNTGLNAIPVITKKEKKVYVLTGPKISGVVIFGNDYLINFNKKNEITSRKKLHNNIIVLEYESGEKTVTTMHNHNEVTGDLITPTDICTLLLYGKFTNWRQHIVMGKNKVSIWNCEKESLFVMKRKAWDKIYNQENKDK